MWTYQQLTDGGNRKKIIFVWQGPTAGPALCLQMADLFHMKDYSPLFYYVYYYY